MAAMVASRASKSPPAARVCSTSKACSPLRDTQAPSTLRGPSPGTLASAMRWVSPVGSRSSKGLTKAPAGVPSSDKVSSMASRKPSARKRAGVTAGLNK